MSVAMISTIDVVQEQTVKILPLPQARKSTDIYLKPSTLNIKKHWQGTNLTSKMYKLTATSLYYQNDLKMCELMKAAVVCLCYVCGYDLNHKHIQELMVESLSFTQAR